MKGFFKFLSGDKTLLYSFSLNLFLLAASCVWLLLSYRSLPPVVPIFNQLPWGNARLAAKQFVFLPIILAFVVGLINLTMSFYIYKAIPLLQRILYMTALLVSLLVFIFIVKIVQLVI